MAPDTTLYTGVYDAANTKGYLAVLSYREPQGVGIWTARLQHARAVDHDDDTATADVDAVETVDLTFLTHADLAGFLTALEGGTNAYMTGAVGRRRGRLHLSPRSTSGASPRSTAPPRAGRS